MASALSLGLLAEGLTASPALAAERRFTFDIPATDASIALSTVAAATGSAIGWPGGLPAGRLHALRGTMTVADALRLLLDGTGYKAERVGSSAYRIVRRRMAALSPPRPPAQPSARPVRRQPPVRVAQVAEPSISPAPAEIVVTGQKQPQVLRDVPLSVSVVTFAERRGGVLQPATRDVFDLIDGVSITNLGPGRNRQFIRGVADSPFNGPSQSTVAVQLDEARVTYDAPDPDLRLIDMQRVEVLKGPQGALYGSGALGGIYHVVTRRPELDRFSLVVHGGAMLVAHGGTGGGGDATINLPVIADRLAVRAVAYGGRQGGWIDNLRGATDINAERDVGGRLAVRWQATSDWGLDLSGAIQNVKTDDSQYVVRIPDVLLRRYVLMAEPSQNDFRTAAATVNGKLGAIDVVGTTSYVRQRVVTMADSTTSSGAFRVVGPSMFTDARLYQIFNAEVRLSSAGPLRWLAGLSYLNAWSNAAGTISTRTVTDQLVETRDRHVREYAAFGEVTVPLLADVTGTLGARVSHSQTADKASVQPVTGADSTSTTLFAPSGALSWKASERTLFYLRYARAVRPGGLAPSGRAVGDSSKITSRTTRRFASDELGTFDLGVRLGGGSDRLSLTVDLFATDWRHIQSDYLTLSGLISTRNAGRARIRGIEGSVAWRPVDAVLLSAGANLINARLVRDEAGNPLAHRHLPVTPDLTVRGLGRYDFRLGPVRASLEAQVNYVGKSFLSFDAPYIQEMGDIVTVQVGAMASLSRVTISAHVDNVADVRGNTFSFGNPFYPTQYREYTPSRPRTISVALGWAW